MMTCNEDSKGGESHQGARGAFTRYLKALERSDQAAEETFDDMWQALTAALVYELKRSGVWSCSPSFLGVFGWRSWHERGPGRTESALEELLVDGYDYVFLKRLPRLKSQLAAKGDVDGLVFLFLRNHLYERRKAHDPLGYKVFKTLSGAVRDAVAAGELVILEGDARIRNPSVLGFGPDGDPRRPAPAAVIEPIVRRWCDDLLPGVVTAEGAGRRRLIGKLRRRLRRLAAAGVDVFRFKDLIDPLKSGVRARWAAYFELQTRRAAEADESEAFSELTGRVAARLERLDVAPKTRRYLVRLWSFLRLYACDARFDALPSNRRLSAMLRIPRERLPGLYETLRGIVAHEQAPPEPALCGPRRPGVRQPAELFCGRPAAAPPMPVALLPATARCASQALSA